MYDLDISSVIEHIRAKSIKRVVLQLPDGLKPHAKELVQQIKKGARVEVLLWGGSCFGACDVPNLEKGIADLNIQLGHSRWKNVIS